MLNDKEYKTLIKHETAADMLRDHYSMEDIIKATELSKITIEKITYELGIVAKK